MTSNPRLIFASLPSGLPELGLTIVSDSSQSIDIDEVPLSGAVLVKLLACSLDPYMRNRMRPVDVPGDMPAFTLGETMNGHGVAAVVRSENEKIPAGSYLYGFLPYQAYTIIPALDSHAENLAKLGLQTITNPLNLPWTNFVGGAGMPAQTAYYAVKRVGECKEGETIFISAAAGAVGQMAIQLAKRSGLKVIASVGSQRKLDFVRSLGADHAFNYKVSDVGKELQAHGPIDIYLDLVGGQTLEATIANCAMGARILICGAISCYNSDFEHAYGVKNLWLVNRYRITMKPVVVIDMDAADFGEFYETVPPMLNSGELKYLEQVCEGFEPAGEAFRNIFTGDNFGKVVIKLY